MKVDILSLAEEKGKEIADAVFKKYGEDPVLEQKSFLGSVLDNLLEGRYTKLTIEKEVYERSLHEAKAFFLDKTDAKFDDEFAETLRRKLKMRLEKPDEIKVANQEELLANLIKIYALDFLLEEGLVV